MKRETLKLLVEAGSAATVLLGLVFVGLELRQNTEAVEAATFQGLTDASSNYLLTIASDPELTRIFAAGSADPSALSEPDAARFFLVSRSYWVRMQNVYSQWRRGTLTADDWQLYEAVICASGSDLSRGTAATYGLHRDILTPAFREFIENCATD